MAKSAITKGRVTKKAPAKAAKAGKPAKAVKTAKTATPARKIKVTKPQGAPPSYLNSVIRKPFKAD